MDQPHFVILGAGPAGCGAAAQLRRGGHGRVTLVERGPAVGGNAGSFLHEGIWLDFGSHRLHSASDPRILSDIQALLGDDLIHQQRRGRIRLRNRWLRFPLKPADLFFHLDPGFALGIIRDMATKAFLPRRPEGNTFASVLEADLGSTICNQFYFPYARKIWGRAPSQLSGIQARKRVTAGSFTKLLRRLVRSPGAGKFYYPREGFGQISRAYADVAQQAGADLLLGWGVHRLARPVPGGKWSVTIRQGDAERILEADEVWSTIPVTAAARMMEPGPPEAVLDASRVIEYRAMILVYLVLDVGQFTTTDAHYFPETEISATRISEPKNYSGATTPANRTVLCAEVPCAVGDRLWNLSDQEIGVVVAEDLARAGLPLPRPPIAVFTRKLQQAYPIYTDGYEKSLDLLEDWLETIPGFLSFGRQGLFAHDNTHHALYMAFSAVDCLVKGRLDRTRWNEYRKIFSTHVVED